MKNIINALLIFLLPFVFVFSTYADEAESNVVNSFFVKAVAAHGAGHSVQDYSEADKVAYLNMKNMLQSLRKNRLVFQPDTSIAKAFSALSSTLQTQMSNVLEHKPYDSSAITASLKQATQELHTYTYNDQPYTSFVQSVDGVSNRLANGALIDKALRENVGLFKDFSQIDTNGLGKIDPASAMAKVVSLERLSVTVEPTVHEDGYESVHQTSDGMRDYGHYLSKTLELYQANILDADVSNKSTFFSLSLAITRLTSYIGEYNQAITQHKKLPLDTMQGNIHNLASDAENSLSAVLVVTEGRGYKAPKIPEGLPVKAKVTLESIPDSLFKNTNKALQEAIKRVSDAHGLSQNDNEAKLALLSDLQNNFADIQSKNGKYNPKSVGLLRLYIGVAADLANSITQATPLDKNLKHAFKALGYTANYFTGDIFDITPGSDHLKGAKAAIRAMNAPPEEEHKDPTSHTERPKVTTGTVALNEDSDGFEHDEDGRGTHPLFDSGRASLGSEHGELIHMEPIQPGRVEAPEDR
jgi:hypothetical protein